MWSYFFYLCLKQLLVSLELTVNRTFWSARLLICNKYLVLKFLCPLPEHCEKSNAEMQWQAAGEHGFTVTSWSALFLLVEWLFKRQTVVFLEIKMFLKIQNEYSCVTYRNKYDIEYIHNQVE